MKKSIKLFPLFALASVVSFSGVAYQYSSDVKTEINTSSLDKGALALYSQITKGLTVVTEQHREEQGYRINSGLYRNIHGETGSVIIVSSPDKDITALFDLPEKKGVLTLSKTGKKEFISQPVGIDEKEDHALLDIISSKPVDNDLKKTFNVLVSYSTDVLNQLQVDPVAYALAQLEMIKIELNDATLSDLTLGGVTVFDMNESTDQSASSKRSETWQQLLAPYSKQYGTDVTLVMTRNEDAVEKTYISGVVDAHEHQEWQGEKRTLVNLGEEKSSVVKIPLPSDSNESEMTFISGEIESTTPLIFNNEGYALLPVELKNQQGVLKPVVLRVKKMTQNGDSSVVLTWDPEDNHTLEKGIYNGLLSLKIRTNRHPDSDIVVPTSVSVAAPSVILQKARSASVSKWLSQPSGNPVLNSTLRLDVSVFAKEAQVTWKSEDGRYSWIDTSQSLKDKRVAEFHIWESHLIGKKMYVEVMTPLATGAKPVSKSPSTEVIIAKPLESLEKPEGFVRLSSTLRLNLKNSGLDLNNIDVIWKADNTNYSWVDTSQSLKDKGIAEFKLWQKELLGKKIHVEVKDKINGRVIKSKSTTEQVQEALVIQLVQYQYEAEPSGLLSYYYLPSAYITDKSGKPVENVKVNFELYGSTANIYSSTTNGKGEAKLSKPIVFVRAKKVHLKIWIDGQPVPRDGVYMEKTIGWTTKLPSTWGQWYEPQF